MRSLARHKHRIALALLALASCDKAENGPPDGGPGSSANTVECAVEAPTSCTNPAIRFADVEPIFKSRCGVCHADDGTGPWPLEAYSDISDWQNEIRSELIGCSMPPPDSGVEMTAEERLAILTWLRCGLPK